MNGGSHGKVGFVFKRARKMGRIWIGDEYERQDMTKL